ncbi:WRKY transcription factor WRKY51-like [Primulina eburnea]|uniref:WRKY transcription factor WRKY51-like n=1 Tax=Primulina eburnea TaxID=1245227 RepID=UPI003C6C6CFA
MDQPPTSLDSNSATTGSSHASNKRKYNNNMGGERVVVAVKIEGNGKKQRSEGSPSDCWSWRKYGQKPIKGSPYPRGYYRCSTSKNCSAKKQVERCKTDATTLIITYSTCAHNHPDQPDSRKQEQKSNPKWLALFPRPFTNPYPGLGPTEPSPSPHYVETDPYNPMTAKISSSLIGLFSFDFGD